MLPVCFKEFSMLSTTLCLCIQNGALLLATKKTGFGAGKLNAAGGKVKPGESPRQAVVRELKEEFGLRAKAEDLHYAALLHFFFDGTLVTSCHVYTVKIWRGNPKETEEMGDYEWHHHTCLPSHRMWSGDKFWMPYVFRGEQIEASIMFNAEGSVVKQHHIEKKVLAE